MNNIVSSENGELIVSIKDIARFSENKYTSVQNLIVRKRKDFEELGLSIPKDYDFKSLRLNEPQTTLLMISLRSNPIVDKFRLNLVKQFYAMKKEIIRKSEKTIESKNNQLKISQKQTQEAVRKRYASSGDEYFCCVKKYIDENELDISSEDFNTILLDEDVITQKKIDRYAPAPLEPFSAYDGTSVVVNIQKMNEICKLRNISILEDDQMTFDFKVI